VSIYLDPEAKSTTRDHIKAFERGQYGPIFASRSSPQEVKQPQTSFNTTQFELWSADSDDEDSSTGCNCGSGCRVGDGCRMAAAGGSLVAAGGHIVAAGGHKKIELHKKWLCKCGNDCGLGFGCRCVVFYLFKFALTNSLSQ
jgi:hypothetical protein